MTVDGTENEERTTRPGPIVESAISEVTGATDGDQVAAVAASAYQGLLDARAPVDCHLYAGDELVGAGASDGSDPGTRRTDVAVDPEWSETTALEWPADPLVVPVPDTGFAVVWAGHGASTAPAWAVQTIAGAAVDAATQRRRRTESAERIDELEAETEQLAEFANIVAHDVRNPLAIAQGHLELAREGGDDHFEKIAEAHDRIQRIIDHTLSMAKQDEDVATDQFVDTATVARDAWNTVETMGTTLTVRDTVRITADGERLQQLFENLFRNSVEHADPAKVGESEGRTGGSATSEDGNDHRNDGGDREAGLVIRVGTLRSDGEETGFYVEDNGPGIPEDARSTVFDRGYSDDGGTGLGLAIVRDIVADHGWSIGITDGSDGGARFEITVE